MTVGLFLHILAAVIWVGGMFFAHQMLRPAAGKLDPAQRLPLWRRVFQRFFPWVWACVVALLLSGYGMVIWGLGGFAQIGLHVHLMQGIGIVMMLAFAHLYFVPWRRMQQALDRNDVLGGAAALNQIRGIVVFNLYLGLVVIAVAATGRYWGA